MFLIKSLGSTKPELIPPLIVVIFFCTLVAVFLAIFEFTIIKMLFTNKMVNKFVLNDQFEEIISLLKNHLKIYLSQERLVLVNLP